MLKRKRGHSVTGGLKMGVNVAAHTRHIFLGSAPPGGKEYTFFIFTSCESLKRHLGPIAHHHSTNSYEPIRFLQTSQNRLINIHRKSLKHISQSALFGFSKNIGHHQI